MNLSDFPDARKASVNATDIVLERSKTGIGQGLLLPLAVCAAAGLLLMLLAPDAPWSIKLVIIALVFLTLKRWGGAVVLVLVQADLFSRESQWISALSGFWGVVFVLIVLLVLMFVARHRLLLQQMTGGSVSRLVKDLLRPSESQQTAADWSAAGPVAARILMSAFRGLMLLLVCVVAGRFLLSLVPRNRELTGTLRNVINADPSLSAGAILIVAMVAFWIVASEISWRQMTAAQSRVYLRSNFLKIHYRDLRMIVIRRLKQRLKWLAAKKGRGKDGEITSA